MLSKILKDANTAPKTVGYKLTKGLATLSDEEEACKNSYLAYLFARYVHGADIEKYQEAACKDSYYAYYFADFIPGADIKKCQEAACKDSYWAYCFAHDIPGVDKERCRIACKGTKYAF